MSHGRTTGFDGRWFQWGLDWAAAIGSIWLNNVLFSQRTSDRSCCLACVKKYNYFTNKNVGYSNQILSLPMAAIRLLTLSRAALVLCKSLSTSSSAADILNDFFASCKGRRKFDEFFTWLFSTLLTTVESWRLNRRSSNLKSAGTRRLKYKFLKRFICNKKI